LEAGWPLRRDLLGHTPTTGDMYTESRQQLDMLITQIATASAKRATLLTAAALLCAWEAKTDTHTWRQQSEQTRRYLTLMQTWGYALSEVEILTCKKESNA
jgi:ParB family chromosome partitioning protein